MATLEINNGQIVPIASSSSAASLNIPAGTAPSAPNEGDMWLSTNPGLFSQIGGRSNRLSSGIYSQTASVTVANTTTETTLVDTTSSAGSITIPSAYWGVGRTFNVECWSYVSNLSSNTITFKVKIGSVTLYTPTITNIVNITNQLVYIRMIFTCISTGASGTVRAEGYINSTGLASANQQINTADITVDTTASNNFDITAKHTNASASNSVTVTNIQIKN